MSAGEFSSGVAASELVHVAIESDPETSPQLAPLIRAAAETVDGLTPTQTVALVAELAWLARCFGVQLSEDDRRNVLMAIDLTIIEGR